MFTVAMAFIGGWAKKVLTNPLVIVALLIVGALICGRFWGKNVCEKEQAEQAVEQVRVYVKEYIRIKEKYDGNKFTAEAILSGCVADATMHQPHCKHFSPSM